MYNKICAYFNVLCQKMESKDRQVLKTKGCNGVDVLKSEDFVRSISPNKLKKTFSRQNDFWCCWLSSTTPQPYEWHHGIANKMLEMLDLSGYFKI